jgi:basic amino acid/polyamine antiporter, APA family
VALRRTLGLRDAVAIGLGSMIGAGLFAVWAPATAAAGRWVLLSLLLAGAVALCNALSSAALAARYPSAGGTYVYGRERLGELPGFLAGWCFVVGKTASCAAMALTVGAYAVPGHERVAAVTAVLLVTALNLAGVQRSARASEVVVTLVLAVLAGLVVARLVGGASDGGGTGVVEVGPTGVLQAAGLLFFAFAGYARIATLGEEVRDPARTIPRAVVLALSCVALVYAVVGLLVLDVLGVAGTATSTAPLAEVAERVWGGQAGWVLRVAATAAALGALLNLVLGISRTSLAMARGGHLPRALRRVDRRRGVPWVAEVVVGSVVLAVVLVADLRGAIGFSSFGVLLYYAVANAAAWTLRGDWRLARTVPVVGLLGCLVLVVTLPAASVAGGLAVVGAGLGWYALTRTGRRARA